VTSVWVFVCAIVLGSLSGNSTRDAFLVVLPSMALCEATRDSVRALKDAPVDQGIPVPMHCTLRLQEKGSR